MQNHLRVLEVFDAYLPSSENWVYRLLHNLPDTDVVIASWTFLHSNFYANDFEYIEFPLKLIETNNSTALVRFFNAVILRVIAILYPSYITRLGGKIDVVHSHFAPTGWGFRKLAQNLRVPHVVSFYGYDYQNLPYTKPQWKERYRMLFNKADLFLCEGAHGARILASYGCPREKISVLRLGVNVRKIPFFHRTKNPGELDLLQVAAFTEKKGQIYALDAFKEALETYPNMSLTLVGQDLGTKELVRTIIRQNHIENKVHVLDWVDYDRLHRFMEGYHVFIHPSCYSSAMDSEGGAPVILLDAQATGMPVISTQHCDIPSLVIQDKTGFLTTEKDVKALTTSIKKFYQMDNLDYRSFSTNARQHIERYYDIEKNAQELKKMYDRCVEKDGRR